MDEKWIRRKYAYYYDELQKMGKFSFREDITIEKLQLPDTIIKTAYRDIKKLGFHGKMSLIEFLMLVSMLEWQRTEGWHSPDTADNRNAVRLSVRRPDLFLSVFYDFDSLVDGEALFLKMALEKAEQFLVSNFKMYLKGLIIDLLMEKLEKISPEKAAQLKKTLSSYQ